MKNIFVYSKSNNLLFSVYLFVIIIGISACAKKTMFMISPVQPAARGFVEVKKDKNNNYQIKIELSSLSESIRLSPPKSYYVVWMVSRSNINKNIGQIKPSSNLKASFETVSTSKPAKIFITAEDDPTLQYPGKLVVLTTDKI